MLLLRELKKKKLLLFTARTCVCSHGANQEKKEFFYCTNSCVVIARTQQEKLLLFTARTCVWSHGASSEKKVFLLHELDQKLVRNYYHIYVGKKNRHFVLCEIQKKSFYCKNSIKLRRVHTARTRIFFQNARTVSKACQIHTQHINYRHQKKETFLIVPTVKTKLFILHELNKKHESDSYCS